MFVEFGFEASGVESVLLMLGALFLLAKILKEKKYNGLDIGSLNFWKNLKSFR